MPLDQRLEILRLQLEGALQWLDAIGPLAPAVPPPPSLSPNQASVLELARKLNAAEFSSWFRPSYVMAFVQVESSFNPHAYRFEPRLNEASYGLMQVLASTARGAGWLGAPEALFGAETGLRIGMKVARAYWDDLKILIGREPSLEEWAVSYNAGVGGEARHIQAGDEGFDAAYANAWLKAQEYWQKQGVDA